MVDEEEITTLIREAATVGAAFDVAYVIKEAYKIRIHRGACLMLSINSLSIVKKVMTDEFEIPLLSWVK